MPKRSTTPAHTTAPASGQRIRGYPGRFRQIAMPAWLHDEPTGAPRRQTQREMADCFQVSERTIREWQTRGMPSEAGPSGSVLYGPKSLHWGFCFSFLPAITARRAT